MITHDVLAFAVASETVRQIRGGNSTWAPLFSSSVHATSSRTWPQPDFVIKDSTNNLSIAGEFKPPNQTKREYLTGLGQAVAYTRDFHYSLLVISEVADDDYHIAAHIEDVLTQEVVRALPVGLISYNPKTISPSAVAFDVRHPLSQRTGPLRNHVSIENSFWAKWRDMSPTELGTFLRYLYDEGLAPPEPQTIRDRAFKRLWDDIQCGRVSHWGGAVRHVSPARKQAWGKNYRNFVMHIGWSFPDGRLTEQGLVALRLVHQYGPDSRVFLDHLTHAVLMDGKHLVLINAINKFQDEHGTFPVEQQWLAAIEQELAEEGLLKRNPGRHLAAVQHSAREFLKAEKTLWKNLELIVPRGPRGYLYHPERGFIFKWARITSLLT